MSRRLHDLLEPGMRGSKTSTLVHVDAGATAGVAGFLQGVQKRSNCTRACRSAHPPQLMGSFRIAHYLVGHTQLGVAHLEPRTGLVDSPADVGTFIGASAGSSVGKHPHRVVGTVAAGAVVRVFVQPAHR